MTITAQTTATRGLRLTLSAGAELLVRAKALYTLAPSIDVCAAPSPHAALNARAKAELTQAFCVVKSAEQEASFDLFPESLGRTIAVPAQAPPLCLRLFALLALDTLATLEPAPAKAERVLPGFVSCANGFAALGAWGQPEMCLAEVTSVYAASTILAYEATLSPRRVCRRFAGGEAGITFSGEGRLWLDSRRSAALRAVLAGTMPAMSRQEEE